VYHAGQIRLIRAMWAEREPGRVGTAHHRRTNPRQASARLISAHGAKEQTQS
jgi:hypothetical protein